MEKEVVKPGSSNVGGVGMKVWEDFRRTVCLLQQRSLWHCLLLLGKFSFWNSSKRESELRHTSVIILPANVNKIPQYIQIPLHFPLFPIHPTHLGLSLKGRGAKDSAVYEEFLFNIYNEICNPVIRVLLE